MQGTLRLSYDLSRSNKSLHKLVQRQIITDEMFDVQCPRYPA